MEAHPDLFRPDTRPDDFRYQPNFLVDAEERELVERVEALPFKEFEFHGFTGKRRVVSFGWRYDFNGGGLTQAEPLPAFLRPLRARSAVFASTEADSLSQTLVTEYTPGVAIGWHRDRSVYGMVIGVSLLSSCRFRFRRQIGRGWERATITVDARSVYFLGGASRYQWEHSIPAVDQLRYSITFRSLANAEKATKD